VDKKLKIKSFSKEQKSMPYPHLLDVQVLSYENFLQATVSAENRRDVGLQMVFKDIFPITDVNENYSLEFVEYRLNEPKYSVDECRDRDMTYAVSLKALLRLVIKESVGETKQVKDILEKEVFLGELPLLTDLGTFIINGAERVIVSQLHRSPGVVFEENIHPNGQRLYSARVIPFRGSWVEFSIDINDIIYVHIDKKKKFPVTALLRTFGFSQNEDILEEFCKKVKIEVKQLEEGAKKRMGRGLSEIALAQDIVDPLTGEVVYEIGEPITPELIETLKEKKVGKQITIFDTSSKTDSQLILNTLAKDPTSSEEDALTKIYSLLRPGEPPNLNVARAQIERLFFNPKRYDLGNVGRYKINRRLGLDIPEEMTTLTKDDFIEIIR
jgi:DNA-directed RNA polymerase subunit beta